MRATCVLCTYHCMFQLPVFQPCMPAFQPRVPAFQRRMPVFQRRVPVFQPRMPVFQLRVPVQLSADVLMGPESLLSPSRPLNPTRFLRLCATHFGRATVAVGWSGGGATGSDAAYYDWWAVKRMHDALTSTEEGGAVPTRVAINVRARWARASLGPLRWLTQMTDASLTLLAEPGESVTVADLLWVRARLPWRRVHYDIGGGALRERFNALKNDVAPVSDRQFDADQWKVAATPAAAQHVYLGTHAVLMRRALLVSRRPAVGGLAGRVHFLQASTAAVLTVLVRVTQAGRPDSLSAVSCAIAGDGGVRVASQSIPGVDRALEARLPASATDRPACLEFVIADTGHNITLTVTRPASCADGTTAVATTGKVASRRTSPCTSRWRASRRTDDISRWGQTWTWGSSRSIDSSQPSQTLSDSAATSSPRVHSPRYSTLPLLIRFFFVVFCMLTFSGVTFDGGQFVIKLLIWDLKCCDEKIFCPKIEEHFAKSEMSLNKIMHTNRE